MFRFYPICRHVHWTAISSWIETIKTGVHSLFAIASGITFMDYGHQWVTDIFTIWFASVLLPPVPSLLPRVEVYIRRVRLLGRHSTKYRHSKQGLLHSHHNTHFKLHLHGRIYYQTRMQPQVMHPGLKSIKKVKNISEAITLNSCSIKAEKPMI